MQKIEKLVEACKKNDAKAQMQLYDTYVQAMYNIAYTYVKTIDEAQDVVQESFLKAFSKIDTYKAKVTFGAWLKRIVIHQSIDYLKKKRLDVVSLDDMELNISEKESDWTIEDDTTIEKIKEKINQLPIKYKLVLQLFLLEGYDHQEIAAILQISEVASRTQLLRGKSKLKTVLNLSDYEKGY